MISWVFATLLVIGAVSGFDSSLDDVWASFKATHGKVYDTIEEKMRRVIFEMNVQQINKHNDEHDLGMHSYTLGINQFADMSEEEFASIFLHPMEVKRTGSTFLAPSNMQLPDTVDWRTQGYVTDVKNQGSCGSCWAFSTTGSLEGQLFKKSGKLASLSEQQLVDCSTDFGNLGCNGGLMDNAFDYIAKNGEETEDAYPYTGRDGKCRFDKTKVVTTVSRHTDILAGNETDLLAAVATVGPVSVAIDAHLMSFRFYKSGVYDAPRCSSTNLDHGVLAVGYGTQDSTDYWIVKNSWGATWGQKGYILMSRNKKNQCGIATSASYPLL